MTSTPPGGLTDQSVRRFARGRRFGVTLAAGVAAAAAIVMVSTPAVADPSGSASASPSAPASGAATAGVVAGTKTYTIGELNDMDSNNPFAAQVDLSYEVLGDTYDTLNGWSQKDYSPTPGLATSWSHTADGLTWTFKIRSGVNWSDGQPMTASDVAYTFNRAIKDSTANGIDYNYVKSITSVDAPDATTAVFHLSAPDSIMTQLWVPILPEHIWKNVSYADTGTFANSAMVGTGAFTLDKWEKGQYIRLKANKNFWGGAPKIDYLIYREFSNEDAMIQAFEKGELDAVHELSAGAYNSLKGQKNITQIKTTGASFDYLAFNTGGATVDGKPLGNKNSPGKDPKFRQAVAYAFDLKTLTAKALQNLGTPGQSIIPPSYTNFAYKPDASDAYTYDPAKAQQLLDAAGYTKDAAGFRINPATKKEMNLQILAPNDSPSYVQSVQFIVAWLKDIGIKTTPKLVTYDEVINEAGNADYDLTYGEWAVEPDPSFQLSTMTCDQRDTGTPAAPVAGWSDSFYCDPTYDGLYKQQAAELDPTKRAVLVKQMQQQLYTSAPYIVLYYPDELQGINTAKWTGYQLQPTKGGEAIDTYGNFTLLDVDLKPNAPKKASGGNTGVLIGGGVVVLVLIVGGVVFAMRRRATADERE
jgi:peptide/nickel transport system substrate-binding protein